MRPCQFITFLGLILLKLAFPFQITPGRLLSIFSKPKSSNYASIYKTQIKIPFCLTNDDRDTQKGEVEMLLEMDIVLFKRKDLCDKNLGESRLEVGAVQGDGTIAPISAWTLESAYPNSDTLEFLVDEEDRFPGLTLKEIEVCKVLSQDVIGYGSRQVGGGKGPGNPHGEESELLYYIERSALSDVQIVLKPELEILW